MATKEEKMLQYEHDFMLVVDNNQRALSRMVALANEVSNRKHGEWLRMAEEFNRRCWGYLKPVLGKEEYKTVSVGGTELSGWGRILSHYAIKYAEGVR